MSRALAVTLMMLAAAPLQAQDRSRFDEARDRINRQIDERLARMLRAKIESDCKEEAKKAYSAIRFNKRREFLDECIATATAASARPALHQAQ